MARLPVPPDGPCAGHPCDACRVCAGGRCCRRDNPDYQLPKLGDWDGPVYVPIGETRSTDGVTLDCHACGQAFHRVGIHAWQSHGLTVHEYRAVFGLFKSQSLDGPEFQRRNAAMFLEQVADGRRPAPPPPQHTREERAGFALTRARLLSDLGKPTPRGDRTTQRGARVRRHDPDRYALVVRLLGEGWSVNRVARAAGLAHATVTRIRDEAARGGP